LTEQTVTTVKVGPVNFSRISSGHLTWGDGSSGVRGWYLTLPHPGQRLVYPIQRLPGTFVLATTLSPADDGTADICLQSGGGRAWSYIIDGVTGSGLQKPALDTDGNGVINTKDAIVSGFEHGVGGSLTRFGRGATRLVHKITFVGVGGGHLAGGGGSANGEFACGQIGTDDCPTSARQWRQIFPR
jgi:type IV pilus assembly protein PilY1